MSNIDVKHVRNPYLSASLDGADELAGCKGQISLLIGHGVYALGSATTEKLVDPFLSLRLEVSESNHFGPHCIECRASFENEWSEILI